MSDIVNSTRNNTFTSPTMSHTLYISNPLLLSAHSVLTSHSMASSASTSALASASTSPPLSPSPSTTTSNPTSPTSSRHAASVYLFRMQNTEWAHVPDSEQVSGTFVGAGQVQCSDVKHVGRDDRTRHARGVGKFYGRKKG